MLSCLTMASTEELMALLSPVIPHFELEGDLVDADQIVRGHINKTYVSTLEEQGVCKRYVHQWINKQVFPEPEKVMENIDRVVSHRNKKRDLEKGRLDLIPQNDGRVFYLDDDGEYWRTYNFVEGSKVFDVVESPDIAYEAAIAFGEFLQDLSDLDAKDFHVTIPDFHHTPKRLQQLEAALDGASAERAIEAKGDLDFVGKNSEIASKITDVLDRFPETWRVTHNDTKVNNVLFDDETMKGMTVIDLDTIMPGSVLFDIGDLVRTACNTAAEDEADLTKVGFDAARFEAIVQGFAETTGESMNAAEWDVLPYAGAVITYECGTRFLADYLNGDKYFQTKYTDHNLVRARTQFELVRQMMEQVDGLSEIVKKAKS